jgi:hypothetical protein
MKRIAVPALVVTTLALVAVLALLLWPREAPPPAPPPAPIAAAPAPAPPSPEPAKAPEPAPAPEPAQAAAPAAPPAPAPTAEPAPSTPKVAKKAVRRAKRTAAAVARATARPPKVAPAAPAPTLEPAAPPAAPPRVSPAITPELDGLPSAIAGILLDAGGAPVRGATVLAVSAAGTDAGETVTDDDGFFLLAALAPGRYAIFPGLGTPWAARLGARSVTVGGGEVGRVAIREPAEGARVRVNALGPDGRAAPAQAVLVAGAPGDGQGVGSVLASETIWIPELDDPRVVLPRVPPGVYTVVLFQGEDQPLRAAAEPLRVDGAGELAVEVRFGADVPRG